MKPECIHQVEQPDGSAIFCTLTECLRLLETAKKHPPGDRIIPGPADLNIEGKTYHLPNGATFHNIFIGSRPKLSHGPEIHCTHSSTCDKRQSHSR